jgi:hypothetical protein
VCFGAGLRATIVNGKQWIAVLIGVRLGCRRTTDRSPADPEGLGPVTSRNRSVEQATKKIGLSN